MKNIILITTFLFLTLTPLFSDVRQDIEELFVITSNNDYNNRPFEKETSDKISTYGETAAQVLTMFLYTEDARYRKRILDMYEILGSRATASILPLLGKGKLIQQVLTILALGETRDTNALPVLHTLLSDTNWRIRNTALMSLAKIHSRDSVSYIIPLLRDSNRYIRKSASYALGEINDSNSIKMLLELLDDTDYPPRFAAIRSLAKMDTYTVSYICDDKNYLKFKDKPIFYLLLTTLHNLGGMKEFLLSELENASPLIRGYAYSVLNKISTKDETIGLLNGDTDPWVRYYIRKKSQ